MRTSLNKLLWIVVATTLSLNVAAMGMGGISVDSALGQQLDASIELMAVNDAEKSSLVARLASLETYKGAGIEYPQGNKFKFTVESHANGDPYLKISSAQPISDPFVSLLVEITWSSGKLLREYTFLLDPPGYKPEQPVQVEVQAIAPAAQAVTSEMPSIQEESMPIAVTSVPAESQAVTGEEIEPTGKPESKPDEKLVETPLEKPQRADTSKRTTPEEIAAKLPADEITVQRGDTLGKIAAQYKPDEVSLERMLLALYRANAGQFDGKNMNRIRTGKILRLPEPNELAIIAQSDAVKEIHAQAQDWNAYRQKLAGAATTVDQKQASQAASGKITSSVADKAPVAKESAKEVLKLSKGDAPGDKTGAGKQSAQERKNVAQEEAIAKAKAEKEEKTRAAMLEKNLKDMQRLAQLKSEELAKMKKDPGAAEVKPLGKTAGMSPAPVASEVAAASGVTAASDVAAAKPKAAEKPKPKTVQPEPSLVDQIMGDPLYLAGAAVLLGIGGLGVVLARRRKKKYESYEPEQQHKDVGSITAGQMAMPVAPSPDTGDFTAINENRVKPQSQMSDDVDPISEADLFLNFGRDAQAEEILKEALQNTPNNHQIHLKLLGIYANRKDVNSFSGIARQLKDSGDEEAWQQAAAMGRRLEPNNPMYGSGTVDDAVSATMQTPTARATMPDFVIGDEQAAVQNSSAESDVDFDLGSLSGGVLEQGHGLEKTTVLSQDDVSAATAMDFDITSTMTPASASSMNFKTASASAPVAAKPAETALPNLEDLIFDVTSAPEQNRGAVKPEPKESADDGLAFTLDFPTDVGEPEASPASAAQSSDSGLSGITLNLDDEPAFEVSAAEGAPAKNEHWQEVATKLDLAKAYQEMGDSTGAREILQEVLNEGDGEQRSTAQSMLDQLG